MDVIDRILQLSSYGARWVLWLLLALSVVSVALSLERAWTLFASRDDMVRLRERLRHLLDQDEIGAARRLLAESPSFEARIARAALESGSSGEANERMAAENELCRLDMEKHLAFLGTVGNNAPFVGLLGTVIGIVRAFHALDQSSGRLSAGLMSEVGEALVATAIGLCVALPSVAAFNAFQRAIQTRLARGEALGRHVLAHFAAGRAS